MANLKQRSKKSCTYKLQLTTTNAKNETLPFHHQTDVRFWFNNIKLATEGDQIQQSSFLEFKDVPPYREGQNRMKS